MSAYRALALQTRCHAVNRLEPDAARELMQATLERIEEQLVGSLRWIGADAKLVVLPEYFLTGFPMGESIAEWQAKACLEIDGVEYETLAAMAQRHGVFIAGNAYELDPNFPKLYFQTSFVIDPAGSVVLRYRRLNSMFAPTPHDVWDRYLDIYGMQGVFPVAATDIGQLAVIASEEILYPELARTLALRGAEVLLHSTSEARSPRSMPKDIAKRARAMENLAYLVSANSAGVDGTPIPAESTDGGSIIVDFEGKALAEAGAGESIVACSEIDLAAVRRFRSRPGMGNLLSRQRLELWRDTYAGSVQPANGLGDGSEAPERSHFLDAQRAAIHELVRRGIASESS